MAVVVLAVLVSGAVVPAAAQEPTATASLSDVAGEGCRSDGLDVDATLSLDTPAGAEVTSTWIVSNDAHSSELGSVTTPVEGPTAVSTPYIDGLNFGGTWAHGLPFAYEIRHTVHLGGERTYEQVVELTCTTEGASAVVQIDEVFGPEPEPQPPPAPDTGPSSPIDAAVALQPPAEAPSATPVTTTPRFTG